MICVRKHHNPNRSGNLAYKNTTTHKHTLMPINMNSFPWETTTIIFWTWKENFAYKNLHNRSEHEWSAYEYKKYHHHPNKSGVPLKCTTIFQDTNGHFPTKTPLIQTEIMSLQKASIMISTWMLCSKKAPQSSNTWMLFMLTTSTTWIRTRIELRLQNH